MNNERIGRNEPCTCGSGKKYKACCGAKLEREVAAVVAPRRSPFPWSIVALGVVVLGMGVYAAIQLSQPEKVNTDATAVTAPGIPPMPMPKIEFAPQNGAAPVLPGATPPLTFTPQPPGEVPPGKVWSTEHGHWHDQVTETTTMGQLMGGATPAAPVAPAPQLMPGPQPPGPVPEGKEWSVEHGHWHDVVTQTTTIQTPLPQGGATPAAPAPAPAPDPAAPTPAPAPAPTPAPAPDATPPQ
jgi:hypothetical protein